MYKIIQKRNYWLGFSLLVLIISVAALAVWGLKLGIDFKGGTLLEVRFQKGRPAVVEVQKALEGMDLGGVIVQPIGDQDMMMRFKDINEDKHQEVLAKLNSFGESEKEGQKADKATTTIAKLANIEEIQFNTVGPSIGQELSRKSFNAMFFVFMGIIIYITWSFRQVSKPVASWKYGTSAIIALIHDALIVLGCFAILGKFYNIEINSSFIAALLTVMGFSVHDTIVVFDRIRENLPRSNEDFEGTVNTSLNQTLARSIITSGTVLLVLLAIYFFGGASIKDFALALFIGIFFGTYSSIFVASPLLVIWEKFRK